MSLTKRQQIAKIKSIIRKDSDGRAKIIDEDGKMCAIGGLAHYGAGVSKRCLMSWELKGTGIFQAFDKVLCAFPVLLGIKADNIWCINDRYIKVDNRRNALCKFFDSLLTK